MTLATALLERPGLLLSLFLALGFGIGGTLVHLSTPPATPRTFERPPEGCGYATTQWMREHGQLDDD